MPLPMDIFIVFDKGSLTGPPTTITNVCIGRSLSDRAAYSSEKGDACKDI